MCSERFRTGTNIQDQNKWLKLNTLSGAPTVGAQLFAPVWCLVFGIDSWTQTRGSWDTPEQT